MLLRSSSAPIPSSWIPHSHSHESELVLQLPKTRSVLNLSQPLSETDFHGPSRSKKKNLIPHSNVCKTTIKENDQLEEPEQRTSLKRTPPVKELFSISGLDKGVMDAEEEVDGGKKDSRLQTLVLGGGGMGSNRGGGRGSDGGHGNLWDYSGGSNYGRDHTDAYYQKMIEANPDNALLLGNYAKYLKEVRGDYPKAEEYLERAILADPGDGNILSNYADLIWQTQKNADRAEGYFDQAVKSAPNNCYVLASYAKFLWDAEEEEEDKDKDSQLKSDQSHTYPPDLLPRANHRPRLSAAS